MPQPNRRRRGRGNGSGGQSFGPPREGATGATGANDIPLGPPKLPRADIPPAQRPNVSSVDMKKQMNKKRDIRTVEEESTDDEPRPKKTKTVKETRPIEPASVPLPRSPSTKSADTHDSRAHRKQKRKGKEAKEAADLEKTSKKKSRKVHGGATPPSSPRGRRSSSRRKKSALDHVDSTVTGSPANPQSAPGPVTMSSGIKGLFNNVGSLSALAPEPKHPAGLVLSVPECRRLASERMQRQENRLRPDCMIALLDLISVDSAAADIYLTLERQDYRGAWISKRLAELGFVCQ